MITKFSTLAIIWLLFSTVAQYTTARTVPLKTTKNIAKEQWKYYLRQVNIYRGLWTRIDSSGKSLSSTTYTRNFTELPNQPAGSERVQLTVTYDDATFSQSGMTEIRFIYLNGNPPRFGISVLPNGTLSSDYAEGVIFYPETFGVWPGRNVAVSSPLFAVEKFLISPMNNRHRITILPVYLGDSFSYISYAREGADRKKYPTRTPFTTEEDATSLGSGRMTRGVYTGVKQCVKADYTYTRSVLIYRDGLPPLLTGSGRVALQLPDGIAVSYPRKVGPVVSGRRLTFNVEWMLSEKVVLRSWAVYSSDGAFFRDCTTTLTKVD